MQNYTGCCLNCSLKSWSKRTQFSICCPLPDFQLSAKRCHQGTHSCKVLALVPLVWLETISVKSSLEKPLQYTLCKDISFSLEERIGRKKNVQHLKISQSPESCSNDKLFPCERSSQKTKA
jgi:hypothetical protein